MLIAFLFLYVDRMDFSVSVLDVTVDNMQQVWPSLACALRSASFVSIDCVWI